MGNAAYNTQFNIVFNRSSYAAGVDFLISVSSWSVGRLFFVNHLAKDNIRSKVNDAVKSAETMIYNHSTVTADVLQITDGIKNPAKYASIGIFTGNIVLDGVDTRVMVVTPAGDLGANYPNAQLIVKCEWPEDCIMSVQRRRRASRAGEKAL